MLPRSAVVSSESWRLYTCLSQHGFKFESYESARQFIQTTKDDKPFDDFWCNFSQTKAERDKFKANIQPLFKIKRALLETTSIRPETVVINKNLKKVYMEDGMNLQLIAEVRTRTNVIWASDISEEVKERYQMLIE